MKIYPILLVYILILFPLTQLSAQKTIPQGYFSSPLDINLGITGSFSEVRPNHFHSGTDFQVQQKEGLPVYAVADGFVSRIKVSPVGFGNALYIDHPNGYTSVYAHLENYNDTITAYLRANQYKVKSFEVDLFPAHKKDSIFVKRGQLIGYAGNSGSSGGAHLHFELRTTVTERIINPLLFGFDIVDVYPPFIDFIKIYPENDKSFIGASSEPKRFMLRKAANGDYRLADKDTIWAWGNFSIGAQAFDYNQSQTDRNGFYSMRMYHNYVEFFSMECDSFSFDESRYVNASIDYADNYNLGNRIVKSKKLPGNKLSFFKTDAANGIINVTDGLLHEILVSVVDLSGNMTNLRFWIQSQKPLEVVQTPSFPDPDSTILFRYDKVNRFEKGDLKLELPAGCMYDNLNFTYKKAPGNKATFSDIHFLHNAEVPLHNRMKVSIKATKLPPRLRSKALLVRVDRTGKRSAADGSYENGWVTATTNLFDGYAIAVDTVAPVIKPWPENKKKNKTSLRFAVSDNLSGIESYRGELNGKWVLVEWDPKNRLMIYRFDFMTQPGTNKFTLFVEDEKGNKSRFSTSFVK